MKRTLVNISDIARSLWNRVPDKIKRVFHTAWVTFVVTFLGGLIPVIHAYLTNNNLHAATTAVGALVITSLVTAGTILRVAIAKLLEGRE